MADIASAMIGDVPRGSHDYQLRTRPGPTTPVQEAYLYTPDRWGPGTDRAIGAVSQLFSARDMAEHCAVMGDFSRDVVWDAPPVLLSRKGHVRVFQYLIKILFNMALVPKLAQIIDFGNGRNLLEVDGTLLVFPHRSILLWPTLLLPRSIPFQVNMKIGVNGSLEMGKIDLVWLRLSNIPALPTILRYFYGVFLGAFPHAAEPLWSYLAEAMGDTFYQRKHGHAMHGPNIIETAKDASSDAYNATIDAVGSIYDGVYGFVWPVYDTTRMYATRAGTMALDYTSLALQKARDTAAQAASIAIGTTQMAVNTATDLAGQAAQTAYGTAYSAYDTAANVAGTATDLAGKAAQTAYGTAANVAGTATDLAGKAAQTAYGTAANAAGAATDLAGQAANTAYNTAEQAYDTASNVANTAAQTARGAAQSAYDTAANTAGQAANTARGAAQAAYDTAGQAAQTARGAAQGAYDTAANTAGQAAQTARGAAQGAYDTAGRAAQNTRMAPNQTYGAANDYANQTTDSVRGPAQQAYNTGYNTAGRAADTVGRTAQSAVDTAADVAGRTAGNVRGAADTVRDTAKQALYGAADTAGKVAGNVKGTAQGAYNTAQGSYNNAASNAAGQVAGGTRPTGTTEVVGTKRTGAIAAAPAGVTTTTVDVEGVTAYPVKEVTTTTRTPIMPTYPTTS